MPDYIFASSRIHRRQLGPIQVRKKMCDRLAFGCPRLEAQQFDNRLIEIENAPALIENQNTVLD